MGDIVDFHNEKASRKLDRSEHFLSLDLFMDVDTSALWARVDNVGEVDIDPDWHRFIAAQLRQLAWIADGMAARDEGTQSAPIACVTVFEDARVNTIHNDDAVKTAEQVKWIGDQLMVGRDEIKSTIDANNT